MTEFIGDIFSAPQDDDAPADGVLPPGSGGIIVVTGPIQNGEEFESRFGGPRVMEPVVFENADEGTVAHVDPRAQDAADADALRRAPIIAAAESLGPDLLASPTDAERAERAAKFTAAIARLKALATGSVKSGGVHCT